MREFNIQSQINWNYEKVKIQSRIMKLFQLNQSININQVTNHCVIQVQLDWVKDATIVLLMK